MPTKETHHSLKITNTIKTTQLLKSPKNTVQFKNPPKLPSKSIKTNHSSPQSKTTQAHQKKIETHIVSFPDLVDAYGHERRLLLGRKRIENLELGAHLLKARYISPTQLGFSSEGPDLHRNLGFLFLPLYSMQWSRVESRFLEHENGKRKKGAFEDRSEDSKTEKDLR